MTVLADAIFNRLSNYAGLTALVDQRIYPLTAPQDGPSPFVVYQVISEVPQSAMGSDTGNIRARVQVDSRATANQGYRQARLVATQVRAALQRYSGTNATVVIDDIFVDEASGEDIYEDEGGGAYRVRLDFIVWYRE